MYHSVYLLNRSLGFPSCGEARRRKVIQDILSSLETWQQRQMDTTETQDLNAHGRGLESDMSHSYEAALQAAHQKALETAKSLQSDLNRLGNEHREGHGSAVIVEIDLGPGLEVELGPILEVGQGIEQELEVKAVTMLIPRMSVPTPQPTTGNP